MAHVVRASRHFGDRIMAILDGQPDPPPDPGDGPPAPQRTAEQWCATLANDREALFARALAADASRASLDRTIEHPMFGPLTWRETLLFSRLHDLDHAGQLQKIATALAAPRPT